MKNRFYFMLSCCLVFMTALSVKTYAQPISSEEIKTQLIADWERAKSYTDDYLKVMPANKYSFKAVDSIRSFAQQMLHLAQGNVFLMSNASDQPPPAWLKADLEHSAGAQSMDSVSYYVNSSYDYCINTVKTLDVNKWGEKKKVYGGETARFVFILKSFEHQTHHRGQTTIYIRLLGIRPPGERLF